MVRRLMMLAAAIAIAAPAQAAVQIDFYAREMGNYFPHAFVLFRGHPDGDPRPVDGDIGFTAVSVSPALLMGPVKGIVEPAPPGYVAGSVREFTVQVTDAQYARVRALVTQWQNLPQPSYDLHKRNCVSFVAAIAREVGLRADDDPKLITKPNGFLTKVRANNPVLGDGRSVVTTQAIAAANGAPQPAAAPPASLAVVAATPLPAPTPSEASAQRYAPQSHLTAAAIAAGYKPATGTP